MEIKFIDTNINRFNIYDAASNDLVKRNALMKDKQTLPEGIYNLTIKIGNLTLSKKNIVVTKDENTVVEIDNLGELSIKCARKGFFRYNVLRSDSKKVVRKRVPLKEPCWLPTGEYDIIIDFPQDKKEFKKVLISENQTTHLEA